jgi:Mn-dependent DtxR family transcriptional regulator
MPVFPPKKTFGNTAAAFLQQRQRQLETFLNNFLNIQQVRSHPAVA